MIGKMERAAKEYAAKEKAATKKAEEEKAAKERTEHVVGGGMGVGESAATPVETEDPLP